MRRRSRPSRDVRPGGCVRYTVAPVLLSNTDLGFREIDSAGSHRQALGRALEGKCDHLGLERILHQTHLTDPVFNRARAPAPTAIEPLLLHLPAPNLGPENEPAGVRIPSGTRIVTPRFAARTGPNCLWMNRRSEWQILCNLLAISEPRGAFTKHFRRRAGAQDHARAIIQREQRSRRRRDELLDPIARATRRVHRDARVRDHAG